MNLHLQYSAVPDWSRLRRRYLDFWEQRVPEDGIIMHIQNPNAQRPAPAAWMLAPAPDKYLDPERFLELTNWRRTGWNWHGDLFNYRMASYGPNIFAGFCGAKPVFGGDTVWHEPVMTSLDEMENIRFDETNSYWQKHVETVKYFAARCRGVEPLGMSDFGGPADWVAQLMGVEPFLIAAYEEPARMRSLALRLAVVCNVAFDRIQAIIRKVNDGNVNWMPVWSQDVLGTVQDDIAIAMSPDLYAEVFLPALRVMAAHTEHTVLHWHDGSAAHLDILLGVENIDVVQYGHDPNTGSFRGHLSRMRQIQAAGKRLFISCVLAEDAEFFISHLDPRGLMMIINTANDKASRRMIGQVREWTRKRAEAILVKPTPLHENDKIHNHKTGPI